MEEDEPVEVDHIEVGEANNNNPFDNDDDETDDSAVQ
jgi:hypothetical protein